MNETTPPLLLCIGGHDPTGGAGVQADIEAASDHGVRVATALTCLTVQDSTDVHQVQPVDPAWLRDQLDCLVADLGISAIKFGLIADPRLVEVCADLLDRLVGKPAVLDPVLAAGGGTRLGGLELVAALNEKLIPKIDLITPNRAEARTLTGEEDPATAASRLLSGGCGAALITGADEACDGRVVNSLFLSSGQSVDSSWPLLPHRYHGSGCTLAATCAARLALGESIEDASRRAQQYTWETLRNAEAIGRGQHFPRRGR